MNSVHLAGVVSGSFVFAVGLMLFLMTPDFPPSVTALMLGLGAGNITLCIWLDRLVTDE